MNAMGGWPNGRRRFLRAALGVVLGSLGLRAAAARARGTPSRDIPPAPDRLASTADLRAPHDLAG